MPNTGARSTSRTSCVVLAGGWDASYVDRIGDHLDIRQRFEAGNVGERTTAALAVGTVDWLLVGPGVHPDSIRRTATNVRSHSPDARLGVAAEEPVGESGEIDLHIPPTAPADDVVAALRLARHGFAIVESQSDTATDRWHALTGRERELLEVLCAGLGNDQIAREMKISRRTVEFHLTRIFRKLGVNSRAEAIVRVISESGAAK